MRVTTHATLAAALLLSAASAFAFNLGDAAKAVAGASQGDSAQVATTPQTSGLLGALTGQLGVSQEQAVGGTGALLGLALAWCVERSDLPARRFWNVVLCLPFAIPAFVSSFTWVSLSPMYEGLGGAILVMTMSKYPLVYLPVAATLRGIDPSLEE